MLRLQNIQVQVAKPLFSAGNQKYLRISVGNVLKTSSSPARIISEQSIQWQEPLQLPVLYNKQFQFEIFDSHEFGYNPEELQTILRGVIVFDSVTDTRSTWEIFTHAHQRIGFLTADIVSKVPTLVKNILKESAHLAVESPGRNPGAKKILRISSIVVRAPNSGIKKGHITIQVNGKVVKTAQVKSRAGELVILEPRQLDIDQNDTDANIKVYSVKAEGQESMIGESSLQLIGNRPSKKSTLMRQGFEVGEIYIESRILEKKEEARSRLTSRMEKSTLVNEPSSGTIAEQQAAYPRPRSISPSRSIDFSRLQHFGIDTSRASRPSRLNSSMVSTISSRKKNSVLNQNNNILFPKEERFKMYGDTKNERVTYLRDRSFQFKAPISGRYYRGASIGYGDKVDFTKARKQNPGVGNYRLPSIWDRY